MTDVNNLIIVAAFMWFISKVGQEATLRKKAMTFGNGWKRVYRVEFYYLRMLSYTTAVIGITLSL